MRTIHNYRPKRITDHIRRDFVKSRKPFTAFDCVMKCNVFALQDSLRNVLRLVAYKALQTKDITRTPRICICQVFDANRILSDYVK